MSDNKLSNIDVKKIAATSLLILFHIEELDERIVSKQQHINDTAKELYDLKGSIDSTKDEKEQAKIRLVFDKKIAKTAKLLKQENKNSKTSISTKIGNIDKLLKNKAVALIVNDSNLTNETFTATLKYAQQIVGNCAELFASVQQKFADLVTAKKDLAHFVQQEELSNILKESTAAMHKSSKSLANVCSYLQSSPKKKLTDRKKETIVFFNMVKAFVKDSEQLQAFSGDTDVEVAKNDENANAKPPI